RDIARERICRYILFFGAFAGAFIGSLSFLAASNGWAIPFNFFDSFNQPAYEVMNALQERYGDMGYPQPYLHTQFMYQTRASVFYWMGIGLFVTFVCCVIRIVIRRKVAKAP